MLNFFMGIVFKNEINIADIISVFAIIISLITLFFFVCTKKGLIKM